MKIYNTFCKVSNYATDSLNIILTGYGNSGYKLVSTEMAKDEHDVMVMYLFFVKVDRSNHES